MRGILRWRVFLNALAGAWARLPVTHKLGFLLFVTLLGSYVPALWGKFVWDDLNNIVSNDRLREWQSLLEVFGRPAMWSANLPVGLVGTYRPLSLATLVVDYKLWGLNPLGFHLTNILLHGASQLALYALFLRLLDKPWQAFALALLSGLHPASVEAIAWINGRSEPMALLFGSLALWIAAGTAVLRGRDVVAMATCLALSMLGKETGVVFVGVAVLIRAARPTHGDVWRELGKTVAAAATGLLVYGTARALALGTNATPVAASAGKVVTVLGPMWFRCLQAALLPFDRAIVLTGSWVRSLSPLETGLYTGLSIVLLALVVLAAVRRHRLVAIGLAWWLAALLPTALLALLDWPGLNRWLYLALPGLLLGGHQLWSLASHKNGVRWGKWLTGGLALVYFVLLQLAIPVWRTNPDLYYRTIVENPEDAFGYQAYGTNRYNVGDYDNAETLLRHALEIDPGNGNAALYLAMTQASRGACAEAAQIYATHPRSPVAPTKLMALLESCVEGAPE